MKRFRLLRYSVGAALLSAVALVAPGALAQTATSEDGAYLQLRQVDSTARDETTMQVTWTGGERALDGMEVTQNGDPVEAAVEPADVSRGVMIVLDTSDAMDTLLPSAKEAVTEFVGQLPEGTSVGLVRYGDTVQQVRALSSDPGAVAEGVSELVPKGGARMWDGLLTGLESLDEEPGLQPNIVLISASPDTGSSTNPARVRGMAASMGASIFAVGLSGADAGTLEELVAETGGRYLASENPTETLTGPVLDSLADQYQVTYPTELKSGDVADLTVQVGDVGVEATVVDGDVAAGNLALAPKHGSGGGKLGFLGGESAKLLGVVLALIAVVLGVYALVLVFTKDQDGLSAVLQPYSESYAEEGESEDDDENSLAKNALIARAVEITEDFAERQGFLAKTEAALERANLPLRAAEALFFYAAVTVIFLILLFILTGNLIVALFIGGITAAIPPLIVSFKASKRRKAFLAQLPDTLQLLSGTLRAGYSLMQGVEAVSQEVGEPMGAELRRVVTESRLGRPLEESLDSSAERMNSPDFSWAVMAIRIQREVGGNLAELLLTVADTMTQRERLRRDVAALTAEGKISAIVLGILPLGLAGTMYVINREYISTLFNTRMGNFMLGYAVVSCLFGFWWMKKTIEIEI